MAGNVTVRDLGWRRFKTAARDLDGKGVKVGIRARDAGKQNDGVDVIDIALWNELGTSDGRVPKRPFMRHTADTSKAEVVAAASRWAGMILAGKLSADRALASLGEFYKMKIQATIRGSKAWAVPNAAETVRRKGSSTPLVDQGVMLGTVDWERDDK